MQFIGKYLRTIYRNAGSGYTKCLVKPNSFNLFGTDSILCAGCFPKYNENTPLSLEGVFDYTEGTKLFKVEKIEVAVDEENDLRQFLISCFPKGFGKVAADKIIESMKSYNLGLSDLMDGSHDECFKDIRGFSDGKIMSFLNNVSRNYTISKIHTEISPYGGTFKHAANIFKFYGNASLSEIKANPYKTMKHCDVPFSIIDSYAHSLNYPYYNLERVRTLIKIGYKQVESNGLSYVDYDMMLKFIRKYETNYGKYDEVIPEGIVAHELLYSYNGKSVIKDDSLRLYSKNAYESEMIIAAKMNRLLNESKLLIETKDVKKYLNSIATKLDQEQLAAICGITESTCPCMLIGKPGTGKTTTIKELVETIKHFNPKLSIALCAPTGRAAERISESTGFLATTIHVLLEYKSLYGEDAEPSRNESNPLDYDVVIVDESSMVGLFLFKRLLLAMRPSTKLILVGDWNQLASIEPGNLLFDLAKCGKFPVYTLSTIHRQTANGRSIAENAMGLLENKTEFFTDNYFEIFNFTSNEQAENFCMDFYQKNMSKDLNHIHIITPSTKGELGTTLLNQKIQSEIFKNEVNYIDYGNSRYYLGDKVMTLKNNYDPECSYFNGDIWEIVKINPENITLKNQNRTIDLDIDNMDVLTLAYGLTIHKFQGSEGDIIIMIFPEDCPKPLIYRSILYTGITRAKSHLVILNVNHMMEKFVEAPFHQKRNSSLLEMI